MQLFSKIKTWVLAHRYKTGAVLIIFVTLLVIGLNKGETQTEEVVANPLVSVTTALQYSGTQDFSTIGTVRAFTEAAVTAETAGRVVSVNAQLGQQVPAGFVIATLENASEQAAVLQAEGVYEAALAAAAQSNVGLDEAQTALTSAQNGAVSSVSSAYNTVNGIVRNSIDSFFANPDARVPGLKIDGKGQTLAINDERVAFQTILKEWQSRSNTISVTSDLDAELTYAKTQTERTIALVDTFIDLFNADNADNSYTAAELQTFSTNFTTLRSTLLGTKSALDSAQAALNAARDSVRRSEIAASGSTASASDAQVKQALGALRAAQANLAKTILRTPISGTVNSLSVRAGDFVSNQTVVARVANNNALEILAYVGEKERDAFAVGETVTIDGTMEGVITAIAPAVDANTGKTEIRIGTEATGRGLIFTVDNYHHHSKPSIS